MDNAFVGAFLTFDRFEKSLYDLIRGLRNHKGNEKEYIQNSLKECRAEIRGQDMGQYILQYFACHANGIVIGQMSRQLLY
jgi:hypothetical protein